MCDLSGMFSIGPSVLRYLHCVQPALFCSIITQDGLSHQWTHASAQRGLTRFNCSIANTKQDPRILTWPDLRDVIVLGKFGKLLIIFLYTFSVRLTGHLIQFSLFSLSQVLLMLSLCFCPAQQWKQLLAGMEMLYECKPELTRTLHTPSFQSHIACPNVIRLTHTGRRRSPNHSHN